MLQYCTKCLYPSNHPLNLTFDEEGVCSGCRVHEEKNQLDWAKRQEKLRSILDVYRDHGGNRYDCIIPVSGARDSWFIVDTIRNQFGMRPLLVSYNRHYNTHRGIRNLAYLRTQTDCDFLQQVLQPQKVKRIMRETLHRMGSFHWHTLAGQTVFPVQVAVRMKIPLIIWGAHQGVDQVGMFSHLDEVEMTRKYRHEHDLMGIEAEDLIDGVEGLKEKDLIQYFYPHDREIQAVGVRGIYLNNYIRWDSKAQHEAMLLKHQYETAKQQRSFDTYNDVDCQHYLGVHDVIKFRKWGYGKAVDQACREIRLGRLTREQALELVRPYMNDEETADLDTLISFMDISKSDFNTSIDRFRDPAAWKKNEENQWILKSSLAPEKCVPRTLDLGDVNCDFVVTGNKSPEINEEKYYLLKRGFVDDVPAILSR